MKITLAQIRLKTGDFEFNFESVRRAVEKAQGDVIVLPDITSLGEKGLLRDKEFVAAKNDFIKRVAGLGKTIITGKILICDGKILEHTAASILSENIPFGLPVPDVQIYVNAVCQADENVYAGGSFVRGIYQAPLCEEVIYEVSCHPGLRAGVSAKRSEFETPHQVRGDMVDIITVTTFALREYCENTGFKKVILGLSGGLDSAVVAALAVQALGAESVKGVLLPSMYSSEGSVTDALQLAKNLGIETETHPITPMFEKFMGTFDARQDLAEENLQSRLRMLHLMFLANREGRLLLATGNKSEIAMGYGTLYGDMAGGFNMIADLTKTWVYKIAEHLPAVPRETIEKPPSAELRPGQKDSDSLPEYAILDDIIEMYLEQKHEALYAKYDKALVDDVIKRICRAQFKRKQACLGVRLTEHGFDFPIVQRYY